MKANISVESVKIAHVSDRTTAVRDLVVENGLVCSHSPGHERPDNVIIKGKGLVAVPGLIDLHVHFRDPGNTDAEDAGSGGRAAARGGFTTVVTMPNTSPPADNPDIIAGMIKSTDSVRVIPAGAISHGRAGRAPSDITSIASAGAGAFSDDGNAVESEAVMKDAMHRIAELGLPVLDHAISSVIAGNGVMHDGRVSRMLGLPGIPSRAETFMVDRDINLSADTGVKLHIQHISTADAAVAIRRAREKGMPVSGEVTPHHLVFTEDNVTVENTSMKMNPPLRTADDRAALVHGIREGYLSVFATDHAPHTKAAKSAGFLGAPFGIVGLETAVGVTYSATVARGLLSFHDWLAMWTANPASILGIELREIMPGSTADFTILDLDSVWTVRPDEFLSKSRNTPFIGMELQGRAVCTVSNGNLTWLDTGHKSVSLAGTVRS